MEQPQTKVELPQKNDVLPPQNHPNFSLKTIEYSDDSIYFGQTKDENIKHGVGKFTFANNFYYIGEWEKDEMNGFGSLFSEENFPIYEGFWHKGSFKGVGVLRNINSENMKDCFEINYNDFNNINERWVKYEGEFMDDLMDGKGKIEFKNGDLFYGNFFKNKIEGKGIYIKKENGEHVNGEWRENVLISQSNQP